MTEHWLSTKWSFVQTENNFDKRTRGFRKNLEVWGFNLKKSQEILFFFEKLIPTKRRSLRVEVSSENRAELFFAPKMRFIMPKVQKSKKSRNFCPNTNFISLCSSAHVEAILTIASKPLLQNSKFLLLRHLKGARSENCSEKTSEWYTEDAKCSFDNSAGKHFAKSQNVFCSKSGNVIKKVSFGNFHFHQNKLLFRYVEGSFDNRAEFSPSKARFFFWLKSKKDRKCKEFFSKTSFRSKNSSVHEECCFEETVSKFLGQISQHLLLITCKSSKHKKCWENVSEWSSGDAKCHFETNAENNTPKILKT